MEKIVEFYKNNKKEIVMFIAGFTLCLLVFGITTFYSSNKKATKEHKNTVEKSKKTSSKKKKTKKTSDLENINIVENNTNPREETNNIPTNNENIASQINPATEDDVVSYFEDVERRSSGNENNSAERERLKSDVAIIHDFLFENGTIKGKTFAELRNEIKLKILKITLSIDQKIDKYFPNYKERIKADYKDLKSMVITRYLEITNKICTSNQQLCATARNDFKNMKNSFKITWSLIKDLAKRSTTALKEWYVSTN